DFSTSGEVRTAAWSGSFNYIQREGHFFKDALYLVDDYKPEVAQHQTVARVLQNYADNTARGRLRADATTNASRPIRGLLLSTGEDVPDYGASGVSRCIVVPVPQREKDVKLGMRCLGESKNYSAVMTDFMRWVIAEGRGQDFRDQVTHWRDCYYEDIAGQQNDIRIAGTIALLAAGFEQISEYLADAWPEQEEAACWFQGRCLV